MPHECTDCSRTFPDGSTEMLSGCPDCGGTKFQYRPSPASDGTESAAESAPSENRSASEPSEPPESSAEGSVARTVGEAATAVRDLVGSGAESDSGVAEDAAQASARTDVVRPEEMPSSPSSPPPSPGDDDPPDPGSESTSDAPFTSDTTSAPRGAGPEPGAADGGDGDRDSDAGADEAGDGDDRPGLAELRAELNEQFESIRVVEPGQYELNLMELYDREEYIIALQEDGKYTIQVPDRWQAE